MLCYSLSKIAHNQVSIIDEMCTLCGGVPSKQIVMFTG